MAIYYGNNVSKKYNGHTYTWKNLTEYTYTDNGNTFTINIKVKFFLDGLTTTHLRFSKGNFYATLTINGTQEASFSNSPEYEIHGGTENAWEVINFSKTYTKTTSAQTFSVTTTAEGKSPSTWKGVSTVPVGTFTINVPALSTMSVTATNGNATYNGSAHYAKIKITTASAAGATVNYGTSTSYGYTLTATNANTDYTLSSVSATNVSDSKTVYYQVVKAGYVTVTGSTTITISQVPNSMTYAATQTWGPTFSTSAQTTTLSAAANAQGGITYSLQSQKQGSTAVSYFSFNATSRVLTMAANTPPNTYTVVVRAHAAGDGNHSAKDIDSTVTVTVGKAPNPLSYTATQSYSKTFSTSAQTQATTAATGAQGALSYTINSQKTGSTTVSYFSLSTTTLTVAANTPAGTYTVVIRAKADGNTNYNSATKDSTITFTISKATNPVTYAAQSWSCSFSTSSQTKTLNAAANAQGTVTYSLQSQKQGSTAVTYFSFNTSTRVLTMAANTPPNTYTVVVRAAAAGNANYNSKNVDSTITVTVGKATPTLSVTGKTGLTYTGSAQALASAWSVTGGGTVYLGLGSSSTTAPTSWSTNASPTATNAGTYYIWAKADASTNYNAVSQVYKVSVTIAKANISPSVTMANWAYGGTASNPSVSGNSGSGTVTYHYKLKSAADSAYSTTKPSDAGVYTVRATIATTTNYNSGTATKDFSITFTATPTPYSAAYNGSAHSASIKTSVGGATVNYGTSTSYGYSLTATNANTNYTMSSVSATNVADSKTVYYKATKNGYTVTGSTSITISKATPTLSVTGATLTFNNSAQTLVSAASVSGNGTIYYGLGSSTTSAPASTAWSTTKPTATNIGTYYIWAKADTSANYNAVTQVYKATATIKAGSYTVTLNNNGGSGGTTSVTATYNAAMPSATMPTRVGYTFAGYYDTSATSGGTQYYTAAGASARTWNKLAASTLYARWTINSYTLTIDPNGGSWNSSTSTSTASQNYATTKAIAAPTRTGYTFVGWAETGPGSLAKVNNADPAFDSSSGGVAIYNNSGGGTVTHTRQSSSAGTAYGSYEILISSSSGTTSPGNGGFYQPTTSAANKKYIHAFVAKIPAGYTVQQACNATGNGRTITWLTDRYGTGAYRVYAYQHNCGSGGTFSTFGHVYLDTGSRPVSWQLAYSAMKDITDGTADTYTYGAGAGRITALWAGNKYSVAFNANGGSGSMTTQTDFFYGTAKALSANGFTAPSGGYSFVGWATSAANAAAGTVAYSNQGNMTTGTTTNGSTVTLYAVWRRTITFKHGKANATTSTVYQYYGGNVTPPTITAISTWTPLGWRDDTSAGAKEYGANNTTAFAYTSTVQTLYAVYSRTLTISYGANGGTGTTPSNTTTTQYYNTNGTITSPAVTLATNPYSQTGCTFSHWLVSTSNTNVASGGSYTWSIAVDASTVSRVASAQWNINVTATNGNATYNGSAHSASISIGIAGATVEYGTSTSYGYTLTATNANTKYSMSSVSATTVAQSTTVYYRVSKSGYLARTGSTTITISKRTVTPTAPTLTTGTLTYDGTAKTLANAGSCTAGGQMYYYVGTSATAPAFSTSTWSTSISTQTSAGTYYIFWYCYVSDTANNNDTSSDNINITKSLGSRTIGKATLTITPTAYSADYNGAAHSAQIKCTNVDSVTIAYGTSTSYGNSLTATTRNTNYTMSSVTRTNPGTTTVYYKASKTNYNDVTGSTTITITGVPVHTKVNGVWKHGIVYVNVNGTWKKAVMGYRNVNGTWKPINK